MPSETDFLNGALGRCGYTTITGIDDGSTNANWCKVFYGPLRRAILRAHHWNFAEARMELPQTPGAPDFEFAYWYTLPNNILKIKEYNGDQVKPNALDPLYWVTVAGRYKVEGNRLLTNDGIVKIVYVSDIDNPTLWDPLFYQAAEAWLASKLAMAIGKDSSKSQSLLNEAVSILMPLAMAVDGQEGTILPYFTDDLIYGR